MSQRLIDTFARLRKGGAPGLVAYVTAGDPTYARSKDIVRALDRAGADVIELGVPFSEPLADGPVIQRATERALAGGMTLARTMDLVDELRSEVRAPIVLFSYANPIYRLGLDAFVARAAAVGVDGVLTLDLPAEEAGPLHERLAAANLDMIFLVSPTTTDERLRRAGDIGSGFLYGVSRTGVTGMRDAVADSAEGLAARMRRETRLPVAIGFGLSRPEHIRDVGRWADAAVVGSALVDVIARAGDSPEVVADVERFVRWLKGAADAAPVAGGSTHG
ncbi:MAG: tryptophan synthase subunit alpha [Vicinamibacteraceae bacterium]